MSIRERQAQEEREEKQARMKAMLMAAGLLPPLLAIVLLVKFVPALTRAITTGAHPQPQHRTLVVQILDNSKSYYNHALAAEQSDAVNTALAKWLSPVQCTLLRFSSRPVEIASGVLDPVKAHGAIQDYYTNVKPDPQPGSFLLPAIKQGIGSAGFTTQAVVIMVATDGFEDEAEVVKYLADLKRSHRVIVLFYATPIHNVRRAKTQGDWRGRIRTQLEPVLHNDLFISSSANDLSDALNRWLPNRLHDNALIN